MKKARPKLQYSKMHELLASPTQPMPEAARRYQLKRMSDGMRELMQAPEPSRDSWRIVSDSVNLLRTLVQCGEAPVKDADGKTIASHWRGCQGLPVEVRDSSGLLADATEALALAGGRHLEGFPLRLTGPGIAAVLAVLEDYKEALEFLPARSMVRCHRETERRLYDLNRRLQNSPDGVYVVAI